MGIVKLDQISQLEFHHDIYKTFLACRNANHTPKFIHILFLGFLIVCNFLKWSIFGALSPIEVKHLKDKISYTIWEFCVGCPIYLYGKTNLASVRNLDDANINHTYSLKKIEIYDKNEIWKFAGLFFCILLLKSFHYLCVDRAKVIFNSSFINNSKATLLRFSIGLALINFIDIILIHKFIYDTKNNILMAIFGFEILNIFPLVMLTTIKFAFNYYEYCLKVENVSISHRWFEVKRKTFKICEFITNFIRFAMACLFATYFLYYYTFPLHILPSSYLSFKVLVTKTRSLVNFKKSEIRISKLLIPKSQAVFANQNCIICLDSLTIDQVRQIPKCLHTYHTECIKSWLDCSSHCPICRQST